MPYIHLFDASRSISFFLVLVSHLGCDTGGGYPGTHPGTTRGWNVGRVVRVVGGADGSPARVRVRGLAKVGYPWVPAHHQKFKTQTLPDLGCCRTTRLL